MTELVNYTVSPITIQDATPFVVEWHYSKNTNGLASRFCFGLFDKAEMIGVMVYAYLGMASVWKKYGEVEKDVVELRRLCCIDDTPKNTESYFIAKTINWLRQNTDCKVVISYADSMQGHVGTIYKAANFYYLGMTAKGRAIRVKCSDRLYHEKTIRTYYKPKGGERRLKPYAQKIKDMLESGEAEYVHSDGKHIFVYPLSKKERRKYKEIPHHQKSEKEYA